LKHNENNTAKLVLLQKTFLKPKDFQLIFGGITKIENNKRRI